MNALYDLNTDPNEMNNLIGNNPEGEKYEEKIEELRSFLLEWLEEKESVHYEGVKSRKLI